jgi:hypothetical protein
LGAIVVEGDSLTYGTVTHEFFHAFYGAEDLYGGVSCDAPPQRGEILHWGIMGNCYAQGDDPPEEEKTPPATQFTFTQAGILEPENRELPSSDETYTWTLTPNTELVVGDTVRRLQETRFSECVFSCQPEECRTVCDTYFYVETRQKGAPDQVPTRGVQVFADNQALTACLAAISGSDDIFVPTLYEAGQTWYHAPSGLKVQLVSTDDSSTPVFDPTVEITTTEDSGDADYVTDHRQRCGDEDAST